jgi:opacity protein-like surface antigen
MRVDSDDRVRRFGCAGGVAALTLLLLPLPGARAADTFGLYLGGAFGQARVEASLPNAAQFREDHSAFKIMAGLRPIPVLGAEIAYVDFGHPDRLAGFGPPGSSDVSMKGAAAFGMFYIPVPWVDVYAKGGFARLQSTANVNCPVCANLVAFPPLRRTDTSWAAGAGAQFKLGAAGIRAEYERFNAAGGNPYLVSLGATWTF